MKRIINKILHPLGYRIVKLDPFEDRIQLLLPHSFETYLYPLHDEISKPSELLYKIIKDAVYIASRTEVSNEGFPEENSIYYNIYPGEHYRLLKAVAGLLQPEIIVEVGTFTGMGCVAMLQGMREKSVIHTFDIIPWDQLNTHLNQAKFDSGSLIQHIADLSIPHKFKEFEPILNSADFIFLDAPKDGVFEYKFLDFLQCHLKPHAGKVLMIDDIRFKNMIPLWRSIKSPKLDITSLGHWTGTGLVDISDGLRLKI